MFFLNPNQVFKKFYHLGRYLDCLAHLLYVLKVFPVSFSDSLYRNGEESLDLYIMNIYVNILRIYNLDFEDIYSIKQPLKSLQNATDLQNFKSKF